MITMSPGHFGKGTGVVSLVDEAVEARKVVLEVVKQLEARGIEVNYVEDTVSKNQQQNIRHLVTAHNRTVRTLDVSIHFNAVAEVRAEGIGTEVLYVSSAAKVLAEQLSEAIAQAGQFKNRGAKQRKDLGFLNGTTEKALLIEVCFVNSKEDVAHYQKYFQQICVAIARTLAGEEKPVLSFSSKALTAHVLKIWDDKAAIIKQLEQGVADGVFQPVWLQQAKAGTLRLEDYLALSILQLKKVF